NCRESFSFCNDFDRYVQWADVIVTHAGAGSVYSMLEAGKDIIVVPNIQRVDKHQLEIAEYVDSNRFGLVCYDVFGIVEVLERSTEFFPRHKERYLKESFFMADEILANMKRFFKDRR